MHADSLSRNTLGQPGGLLAWRLLVLAIGLIAGCAGEVPSRTEAASIDWQLVPGERIGPVRLGMSAFEVTSALGSPESTAHGPFEYLALNLAVIFTAEGRVEAILCGYGYGDDLDPPPNGHRCRPLSPDGIGIGSTRAQVVERFGQPEFDPTTPDGTGTLMYRRTRGVEFVLRDDKVSAVGVFAPPADR